MRKPAYYSTSLQSHHMASYVQTYKIRSSSQISYDYVRIKVVIAIKYFLIPTMLTFMYSPWHTYLCTTIQIRILFVYLTHSCLIYLLKSPTYLRPIFLSLLSGNLFIMTLPLTLTLIYRDALWKLGSRNP